MRYYLLSAVAIFFLQLSPVIQAQHIKSDTMMSKKILGLRTCIYLVSDLTAAKNWYAEAFGVKPYFDEPFYVGFNIGGYELGLMPGAGSDEKHSENVLTYWGVEDVKGVYDAFLELGAQKHEEPHNVGGDIEVASVRDPWGNVIGMIYNPAFNAE